MRNKSLAIITTLKDSQMSLKVGNPVRTTRKNSLNMNILLRSSCETPTCNSNNYFVKTTRDLKASLINPQLSRKSSFGNTNLNEKRQFSNVLINEKTEKIEKLPLCPEKARKVFDLNLNSYEKIEILRFKEIFYVGQGKKKECNNYDDEQSNLILYQDDHIAYRYQVKKLIGVGSFSQVYEAYDWKKKSSVALKVIRNKKKYKKQADLEINFLKILKEKAANLPFACILTSFEFREHVCIAFRLLGNETSKVSSFSDILKVSIDILACLQFLHSMRIVHCDLKPSNVLVSGGIAHLIDLGTSTRVSEQVYKYVQSRSYRAPEVIFRLKYDEKIDIWSFGCVLFELIKGRILFEGNDENEILDQIIQKIGEPPVKWKRFCLNNHLQKDSGFKLCELVQDVHPVLQEVILKCLKWRPKQRISAEEALELFKRYAETR